MLESNRLALFSPWPTVQDVSTPPSEGEPHWLSAQVVLWQSARDTKILGLKWFPAEAKVCVTTALKKMCMEGPALSNLACFLALNKASDVRVGQRRPPACVTPGLIVILSRFIKVSAVKSELISRG